MTSPIDLPVRSVGRRHGLRGLIWGAQFSYYVNYPCHKISVRNKREIDLKIRQAVQPWKEEMICLMGFESGQVKLI